MAKPRDFEIRKQIHILIVLVFLLSLLTAGCGGGGGAEDDGTPPPEVSSTRVTITYSDDDDPAYIDLATTSDWMQYTGFEEAPGFIAFGGPQLLPTTPQIGVSWDFSEVGAEGSATVGSVSDTVTVPAGVFTDCVRVDFTGNINGSRWFAHGVGLLKYQLGDDYVVVLNQLTISGESADSWWPLDTGNSWEYVLQNDPQYVCTFTVED